MAGINGYNGNISGNGIVGTLNTWSATISRVSSDITGFSNVGRNRLLGLYDMTGSAGGIIDTTTSFVSSNEIAAMTATSGASVTLTAESGNTIAANCVVSSVDMGLSKAGDATVTFNFELASTATTGSPFTISWS